MLPQLKSTFRRIVPQRMHPSRIARIRILRKSRGHVISGPFAGQIYVTGENDFIEPGMLIGCYEKEIHGALEAIIHSNPSHVIDVGAAQGYYAVGLARRLPSARHIAFECFEPRVSQLRRTTVANKVTAVELWGQCDLTSLARAVTDAARPFILMDVDGPEDELLNPQIIPSLRKAQIIVETHDYICPGVTARIKERFEYSHSITSIDSVDRTRDDLPFFFRDRWLLEQVNEGRQIEGRRIVQQWLVMEPKSFGD